MNGASGSPTLRAGLKVLVVDDNTDAADSLGELLTLTGHQSRTAYDGSEALEIATTFLPDVVLCDLGMPGIDGYEVARRLRALPAMRRATLVALTGWGSETDRERSAEAGFDTHLTKPVRLGVLQKALADAGRSSG